jgi:hypothetical protein
MGMTLFLAPRMFFAVAGYAKSLDVLWPVVLYVSIYVVGMNRPASTLFT